MMPRSFIKVSCGKSLLRRLEQSISPSLSSFTPFSGWQLTSESSISGSVPIAWTESRRFFSRYDFVDGDIDDIKRLKPKLKKARVLDDDDPRPSKKAAAKDEEIEPPEVESNSDVDEEEDDDGIDGVFTKRDDKEKILVNEFLIRELMRRAGTKSAKQVQVRLVVHQGRDKKPLVELKTLDEAIDVATAKDVDLVGMSIKQNPPVVAARRLSAFLYQKEKANAKNDKQNRKPDKQFKFRTGIAEADLSRRMNEILKFLDDGHACIISASSAVRGTRDEKQAAIVVFLNKIIERVGSAANAPSETEIEEGATLISIRLEPTRKGKKKKE